MVLQNLPILSLLIILPVLGAIPIAFFRRSESALVRTWALLVTLVELVVAVGLALAFRLGVDGPQFVERANWVPALGLQYLLGADGISLAMVLVTALLGVVAIIASWQLLDSERARLYAGLILLLEAAVIGSFLALDLVLFFFFWEAMLIPAYLLVGVYGGQRRIYAAYKFFLYTAIGSLLMLVGIIALWVVHVQAGGTPTFELQALARVPLDPQTQTWIFLAFALAFAIKVPIWPLHTWLPDLYTQTPLGAMVLVGILTKVGAYGFIRFTLPLFPQAVAAYAPLLVALGLVGLIYGGLSAYVQRDIVLVIAYSSIAHLGFVILGIFSLNHQSIQGAVVQMVNHGITSAALFVIAATIYARTGTTEFAKLGGVAAKWPVLATVFLVTVLSSAGTPGLNGFVGEFLVVYGAWVTNSPTSIIAGLGIILAAVYLITMYRRSMHGTPGSVLTGPDLSGREVVALIPLIALIVAIGVYPAPLLNSLEAGVNQATASIQSARAVPPSQVALQSDPAAR